MGLMDEFLSSGNLVSCCYKWWSCKTNFSNERAKAGGASVSLPIHFIYVRRAFMMFLKTMRWEVISIVSRCVERLISFHTFYLLMFIFYFVVQTIRRFLFSRKFWKLMVRHLVNSSITKNLKFSSVPTLYQLKGVSFHHLLELQRLLAHINMLASLPL